MTKSTFFVEEDKILAALFDVGLDNLHLYKPETSPIYSERLLSLLPDKAYEKIFVHGHYYLKDEYRLAGIHLDNAAEPVPEGYKGKVGRTCRDLTQLKELKKQSQKRKNQQYQYDIYRPSTSCILINNICYCFDHLCVVV
jgi:thiamine-phosphate pyrophosphorylase